MKKRMLTVKPYHILAERFGLFAVRLPSLSRGNGLLGCGITFDILPMFYTGQYFYIFSINLLIYLYIKRNIHYGDLGEGYNVIRSEMKK